MAHHLVAKDGFTYGKEGNALDDITCAELGHKELDCTNAKCQILCPI